MLPPLTYELTSSIYNRKIPYPGGVMTHTLTIIGDPDRDLHVLNVRTDDNLHCSSGHELLTQDLVVYNYYQNLIHIARRVGTEFEITHSPMPEGMIQREQERRKRRFFDW